MVRAEVSGTLINTVVFHLPLFVSTIQHPGHLYGKASGLGQYEGIRCKAR